MWLLFRFSLLSPQKNGIIGITNIFKETDCVGIYVNPDNIDFQRAINSQIYVDKSGLIELTNAKLFTEQQFICVSRPRRFGKSMTANMLTAYYSSGCDSREMFSHPEWQRRTIEQLILTIINIETMPVQIIVSSHSPVILSDFPRDNIIYLKKPNDQKTSVIDSSSDHNQSFGANIYTLFNDAFFMSNGVVGEFAKNKILEVYKELTNEDALTKEKSYYQYFIDQIGNDIIRNEMRKLLKRKLGR